MDAEKDRQLFALAQQQSRLGQTRAVVQTMRELVRRRPKSGLLAAVLANALASLGEMDEAERYFQRAVGLAPKSEKVSLGLFHCLWGQGKTDAAFEEMKRFECLAHSPEYQAILNGILKSE
jgi:predicted Zn-dependent protease